MYVNSIHPKIGIDMHIDVDTGIDIGIGMDTSIDTSVDNNVDTHVDVDIISANPDWRVGHLEGLTSPFSPS